MSTTIGYKNGYMFKLFNGSSLPIGAKMVLTNRLYVPGWSVRQICLRLQDLYGDGERYDNSVIVMAIKGDTKYPTAIALYDDQMSQIHAFTRVAYRREGLGSQCVEHLKNALDDMPINAVLGSEGSDKFWERTNVPVLHFY
jgi:hypothetical protein